MSTLSLASLRSRIVLSFLITGLLMGILLGVAVQKMNSVIRDNEEITTVYNPTQAYANAITAGLSHAVSRFQSHVYTPQSEIEKDLTANWQQEVGRPADSLRLLAEKWTNGEKRFLHNNIAFKLTNIYSALQAAAKIPPPAAPSAAPPPDPGLAEVGLADSGAVVEEPVVSEPVAAPMAINAEVAKILEERVRPLQEEVRNNFALLLQINSREMAARSADVDKQIQQFRWVEAVLALLAALLVVLLVRSLLLRPLRQDVQSLESHLGRLSRGHLPDSLSLRAYELAGIASSINTLTGNLRNMQLFATYVGKGELENDIQVFDDQGDLGKSLSGMRNELRKVSEADKERFWTNEGITKFGEILRLHNDNLTALTENVLTEMVKYTGANQGGIFVTNSLNSNRPFLELKAAYAFDKKKYLEKEVLRGQGLVGQVWQEGGTVYLKEIPSNYVHITSGLGLANPNTLLIVPLRANGEIQGVLEMASFGEFQPHEIAFVETVAESIAATIASTRIAESTRRLLEESQQMAEQMRAQEEEMRQNMEELQATQEEMFRSQRATADKEASLNALINHAEDGIITLNRRYEVGIVNRAMQKLYEAAKINLVPGMNVLELLDEDERRYRKGQYDRALAGESLTDIKEVPGRGKTTIYFQVSYFPVRNEKGEITSIAIFARDISYQKRIEMELQEKQTHLQGLIDTLEDSVTTLDKDYRFTVANSQYRDRYLRMGINLVGSSVFDVLDASIVDEWKGYYDRALAGERFVMTKVFGEGENQLTKRYTFEPLRDEKGNVMGVAIISRDITETVGREQVADQLKAENLQLNQQLAILQGNGSAKKTK